MVKHTTHKHKAAVSRRRRKMAMIGSGVAVLAAVGIGIAVFAGRSGNESTATAAATPLADGSALPTVDVYKSPTCACCSKWVEHLRDFGITVHTTDTEDMTRVKARHAVPPQVESCHTALVDGYVIEGHVPAATIRRLLDERPGIAGLAVAGMPIGSPGMEVPGVKAQPYNVLRFDKDGETRVFAEYP